MSKCKECGYIITTEEGRIAEELYGCARVHVTKGSGMTFQMCKLVNGVYYAPGTNPEEIQEDPNAFKENYQQLIEQKNGNSKK